MAANKLLKCQNDGEMGHDVDNQIYYVNHTFYNGEINDNEKRTGEFDNFSDAYDKYGAK